MSELDHYFGQICARMFLKIHFASTPSITSLFMYRDFRFLLLNLNSVPSTFFASRRNTSRHYYFLFLFLLLLYSSFIQHESLSRTTSFIFGFFGVSFVTFVHILAASAGSFFIIGDFCLYNDNIWKFLMVMNLLLN